jgi:tetratricopeptide (TPR) repeat protein/tRNA A-37 threonylcarbamoyl transferase component Bud32
MSADCNLLFGILALQMDFISRDALIQGMHAWVLDKAKPLSQILVEQGSLAEDARSLLVPLVQKHLQLHGHDAEKSLASVHSVGSVRDDLRHIANPELHASLGYVSVGDDRALDPEATRSRGVGTPTSAGSRFRILRAHAMGGLGAVFVAQDEELHREVALKEIQERHADRPESRSRFLLEAEITGGLEHPGIVPVYGLGQYPDGRPFYAMRFIRGDSLKDAVQRFHQAERPGRDPGERALALRELLGRFVDVCNAVAYAHSRGVLHRDLKPSNVMLGKYGETLVVDWGLAKPVGKPGEPPALPGEPGALATGGLSEPGALATGVDEPTLRPTSAPDLLPTLMGKALGTPQYMPPEQAAGRLDLLGPASDVYSLGATFYCLLTGQAPFKNTEDGQVLQQVQRGQFRRPRQVQRTVPPPLEAICLKAMALRPKDRYASAKALADDVEHWLADEPVSAWPEPLRVRAGRWVRRHRTLVTAAAATLLAVLVVGGGAWVLVTEEQTARLEQEARQAKQRAERTRLAEEELRRAVERRNEARQFSGDDVAKWNEAFAAVKRAEGLLTGGEADAALRAQVRRLLREMEAEARDRRLLEQLDDARLQSAAAGKEAPFDYAGAFDLYARALRQDGLDVLKSTPREAARWLNQRRIKPQLVAAMEEWADYAPQADARQRLRAIIAAADPNPGSFRRRWRQAAGNRKELARLAAVPQAQQLPASDQARLGTYLIHAGESARAAEFLRSAWARYPGDFWINFNLAYALARMEKPRWGEAIRFYTAALAIRPRSATVYSNLGVALENQQDLPGAVTVLRKAIQINPRDAGAYTNLGNALAAQKDLPGAIAAHRKAIAFNPRLAEAYTNLGNALTAQKDLLGAVAACRKAIDIIPRYAGAYNNLGIALAAQKDLPEAVAAFRKAIAIDPRLAMAYYNLANALGEQQDLPGAVAAYRKAIDINPKLAVVYYNLGNSLYSQQDLPGAVAAFRKVIEISPKDAEAHYNLGVALADLQDLPGAVAGFRKAIEINPRFAGAYCSLGNVLRAQQDLPGAVAAYRKAIDLHPKFADAYGNLGKVLGQQGEFAQALASFKQAAKWLPMSDRRRPLLLRYISDCQRFADLENKLPAVLGGKQPPGSNGERLEYARVCHVKGLYAAECHFYDQAFAADPRLAGDLKTSHRYYAACVAALAAAGKGKDAAKLDSNERARWRRQAVAWLRADLARWTRYLDTNQPPARAAVLQQLRHWQRNPDLAGLRDATALAQLPPEEQAACKKLWADVQALLQKAQSGKNE